MRPPSAFLPALGVALTLSWVTQISNAFACGPTPDLLTLLLPVPDATGVPPDAALIVSSNRTTPAFRLRLADSADAGAGADLVPLEKECYPTEYAGELCIARPVDPLEPDTRYEWSLETGPAPGPPSELAPTDWRAFTTSSTQQAHSEPHITVDVVRNETYENPPCGNSHLVTLAFTADLESPVVINLTGFTPSYVMEAVRLTPEASSVEMNLYNPPACVKPEVFDVTGARTTLPRVCPEDELAATAFDSSGEPIAAGAASGRDAGVVDPGVTKSPVRDTGTSSGCRAAPSGRTPGSALALLAAAVSILRRRRGQADRS